MDAVLLLRSWRAPEKLEASPMKPFVDCAPNDDGEA